MKLNLNYFCSFVFLLNLIDSISGLHCIQCDRTASWYTPSENEKMIHLCQKGEIAPTKCHDPHATHCIYSYFKKDNSHVTITERKCGRAEDIVGCTLYKHSRRKLRHLLGGSSSDKPVTYIKRRETTFVEVCTEGCEGDYCINSSPSRIFNCVLFFSWMLYRLI